MRIIVIAGALLAMGSFIDPAFANVDPATRGGKPTQVSAPRAATFVAPRILPRLLVTSLPR